MNTSSAGTPDGFQAPAHRVNLYALVDDEEIPLGSLHTVMLVPPKHANENEGRISTFAPLGRALLGVRVGSVVDVPLANGNSTCVQVLAVRSRADARSPGAAGA
jgi:regulator of nucleoside diphosphate kinase